MAASTASMPPRMSGSPMSPPNKTSPPPTGSLPRVKISPPPPKPAAGLWDHLAPVDGADLDMRDNATIAAHRTAARTGTTFDMADLLTNGTATKPPGMYLPKDQDLVHKKYANKTAAEKAPMKGVRLQRGESPLAGRSAIALKNEPASPKKPSKGDGAIDWEKMTAEKQDEMLKPGV